MYSRMLLIVALLAVPASVALAAEQPLRWKQTGTLTAPEAFQAAAADEKFLYAITNDAIAKYDRETGERVAVSTGEAKHLNSGFFWKGSCTAPTRTIRRRRSRARSRCSTSRRCS